MKAAAQGHYGVAAVAGALGVEAGELHCALVRLRAGIGEERLPYLVALSRRTQGDRGGLVAGAHRVGDHQSAVHIAGCQLGQNRSQLAAPLDVVVVGDVQQALRLTLDSLYQHGMAVAQGAHADTSEEVAIFRSVIAHQRHAVPFDKLHGHARERIHYIAGFQSFLQT